MPKPVILAAAIPASPTRTERLERRFWGFCCCKTSGKGVIGGERVGNGRGTSGGSGGASSIDTEVTGEGKEGIGSPEGVGIGLKNAGLGMMVGRSGKNAGIPGKSGKKNGEKSGTR